MSSVSKIESIENKLKCENLSNSDSAVLYTNLAAAQHELGLFRKCIKSCQNAIDLSPKHTRAYILKGKALVSSDKSSEAVKVWSEFLSGDTELCDVLLIQELKELIASNSNSGDPSRIALGDMKLSHTSSVPIQSVPVDNKKPVETAVRKVVPVIVTEDSTTPSVRKQTSTRNNNPPPKAVVVKPMSDAALAHQATIRKALVDFHCKNIGNSNATNQIKPLFLQAMKSNLPHLCGEDLVDDLVGLGYINVNSGNHQLAITIFKLLLDYRKDLPSALIGLGSIHAMQRHLDVAIKELSDAIEIDPQIADAWKRRGQTKAAKGLIAGALKDLTTALSLQSDADIYNQRGLVYNQAKNYTKALADFRAANAKGLTSAALLNYIGMCEGQIGNVSASIESHKAAVSIDPKLREAFLNMALMYKESGQWEEANKQFANAINADTSRYFSQAHNYRSVMWYQLGRPALALKDTTTAITTISNTIANNIEPNTTQTDDLLQNLIRAAICCQALGQFRKCVHFLDRALLIDKTNNCWFQREIALFFWHHLDTDLSTYSADDRVDSRLKDGWCKHVPFRDYMSRAQSQQYQGVGSTIQYIPLKLPLKIPCVKIRIEDDGVGVINSTTTNNTISDMKNYTSKLRLLEVTKPFSSWIQLQTPGFLPNLRQHRMFGLAVFQMARALRRHIMLIKQDSVGLEISDHACSKIRVIPECTSTPTLPNVVMTAVRPTTPLAAPLLTSLSSSNNGSGSSSLSSNIDTGSSSGSGDGTSSNTSSMNGVSISSLLTSRGLIKRLSSSSSTSNTSSSTSTTTSSSLRQLHQPSSGKRGHCFANHTLSWRDLFDFAVRWRQASEPNDPVWWIDRFPHKAFSDGFGLQTPIVNGQMKTVRYYPYFEKAFNVLKSIMRDGYYSAQDKYEHLNDNIMTQFNSATTLSEIYTLVQKDFYVVVPCPSLKTPGVVLEGTRLTLVLREPDGFEFTIRTPGKPHRWSLFESELDSSFQRLEDAFLSYDHTINNQNNNINNHNSTITIEKTKQIVQDQLILKQGLELFYLWVTFAPLSRGTAACGYAALLSVLLAHNKKVCQSLPQGKQLDWEAIFAENCKEFIDNVITWFPLIDADLPVDALNHDHNDDKQGQSGFSCITTLRDMLEILALPYKV